MLSKEYTAKTEKAAIKMAVDELGIAEENLQIVVLSKGKSGFLGIGDKEEARIKVQYSDTGEAPAAEAAPAAEKKDEHTASKPPEREQRPEGEPVPDDVADKYEDGALDFLEEMFTRMGLEVDLWIKERREGKVFIEMKSPSSALIIGKRGKTLEAVQLLTNIVSSKKIQAELKCVIDIEGYRDKRQEALKDLAFRIADEVRKSNRAKSLEPMNPFERRLIHLALQDEPDIETSSEGEGIYRKVRISLK